MVRARSVTVLPWWWDAYFGVVGAALAIAAVAVEGPHPRGLLAAAAIAGMAVLHLAFGRRLIERHAEDTAALLVLVGELLLFAVSIVAVPFTTWLLFAVIPLIFQMVGIRVAVALVVVVNVVPVVAALFRSPSTVAMQSLIAVISIVAGIGLGFWIMRVIEQSVDRARLIEELENSRAEVVRLSHETGVAAERARLSGEIHDTLAQGFTSIITLLQAADPQLRDERVALAVRTAKENLAEARALVAALSPSALSEGGLPDSVRRQAARFAEETGTPATFRTTGDLRDLPTKVEVVLLRAAQEALTNVRRHACAHEAAVLLAYTPSHVRLVVRDDGRGFPPGATDGYGLSGMRARAGQVDGTLTVRSDAGTGTTIELEVSA